MDIDGVLVHEANALPGADRFLAALRERGMPFLLLTNNSIYPRRDLAARLRASGLDVPGESIVAGLITKATGVEPYFVGKPNPLMMRSTLNALNAHSETTAMIGDLPGRPVNMS